MQRVLYTTESGVDNLNKIIVALNKTLDPGPELKAATRAAADTIESEQTEMVRPCSSVLTIGWHLRLGGGRDVSTGN